MLFKLSELLTYVDDLLFKLSNSSAYFQIKKKYVLEKRTRLERKQNATDYFSNPINGKKITKFKPVNHYYRNHYLKRRPLEKR